jgi:hypothetical protein
MEAKEEEEEEEEDLSRYGLPLRFELNTFRTLLTILFPPFTGNEILFSRPQQTTVDSCGA